MAHFTTQRDECAAKGKPYLVRCGVRENGDDAVEMMNIAGAITRIVKLQWAHGDDAVEISVVLAPNGFLPLAD